MAGLVPAIHGFILSRQDVDARDKRGHDRRRERFNLFGMCTKRRHFTFKGLP
jgi:hypothetical protein